MGRPPLLALAALMLGISTRTLAETGDELQRVPLIFAAGEGDASEVESLLASGSDISQRSKDGRIPSQRPGSATMKGGQAHTERTFFLEPPLQHPRRDGERMQSTMDLHMSLWGDPAGRHKRNTGNRRSGPIRLIGRPGAGASA